MVDSPRTKPRKGFFTDPGFKSSAGHCQCHHVIFNQQTTTERAWKKLLKDSIYIFKHNFLPLSSLFFPFLPHPSLFPDTILNQEYISGPEPPLFMYG